MIIEYECYVIGIDVNEDGSYKVWMEHGPQLNTEWRLWFDSVNQAVERIHRTWREYGEALARADYD